MLHRRRKANGAAKWPNILGANRSVKVSPPKPDSTLEAVFLTFARPREPAARPTDLAMLVQDFSEVFKHEAANAKIEVMVSISPPVNAPADPDMIRQVLWNLAQNAAQALSE